MRLPTPGDSRIRTARGICISWVTGRDEWLPFDFLEVPRVGLVETLVRETLIDGEQDWWKSGTAGAY